MIKFMQSSLCPKVIVLIGDESTKGSHLSELLINATQQMVAKIAKDDLASKLLLTKSRKATQGTFFWEEYDKSANCLIAKIDDKIFNTIKYRSKLIKTVSNLCQ